MWLKNVAFKLFYKNSVLQRNIKLCHVEHVNNCASVVIVIHLKLYVCLDYQCFLLWGNTCLCGNSFVSTASLSIVLFVWLYTGDLEPRIILVALMFYSEHIYSTEPRYWKHFGSYCWFQLELLYAHREKMTIKNCFKVIETCFNFPLEMTSSFWHSHIWISFIH